MKSLKWTFWLLLATGLVSAQTLPTIEEKTKSMKAQAGFLPYYLDEESGRLYLEVNNWGQELLYITSLSAGLGSNDIGLDRGKLGEERMVYFEKQGRKVWMVQPNYGYRAISSNTQERKAVQESFAQSILWGFSAEAATGHRVLVDATDFLLRDATKIAATLRRSNQGSFAIDKSRSAVYLPHTRNFPKNTELEATITFTNTDGNTGAYLRSVAPSDEAVSLRLHHSLVQLPPPGYQPRVFDARSSFIPISYYDFATPVTEPIQKFYATRHRLEKKDKTVALSEAVEPIVYYLDNGTPSPIREALLEGASWWNQAFEAAGYKNAFQVKILPDSADPMDIRYNMINWVHRSTRGWSYGAAVVDPRTGEIIKGNVTLGSLRVRQDYLIFSGLLAPFENGMPANNPMLQAALARLRQLSAHEVGHTLGLMHNYASSVNNRASVMDYPHPLITLDANGKMDFSQVFDSGIGEWDKVAIHWGYGQWEEGSNEQQALQAILQSAMAKGLQYISDRDARDPGGLHAHAHLWDNGTDAAEELMRVMQVRTKALAQFGENNVLPGTPLSFLEEALVPVYFYHRYQIEAAAKCVAGATYNYALRGDGQAQLRPLPAPAQQAAILALLQTLQPAQLAIPEKLYPLIPPRPAGYEYDRELFARRTGLGFDQLSPAEALAQTVFGLILHPERLNRLVQQKMSHANIGAYDLMNQLVQQTFKANRSAGMQLLLQQQTEQVLLTYLLHATHNPDISYAAKAEALQVVNELKAWLTQQEKLAPAAAKGHYQLAIERSKTPEKAMINWHKPMPPGAPIGCDVE